MFKINAFSVLDTNALLVLEHKHLFVISQKVISIVLKGYLFDGD